MSYCLVGFVNDFLQLTIILTHPNISSFASGEEQTSGAILFFMLHSNYLIYWPSSKTEELSRPTLMQDHS